MARITGINSGLDIDALVKASMTAYQSKIDKEAQNKKVLEYQQEQYKKIISDAANFYDKYFDILKTGNLMSTNSYQSVSFKSGDDTKVTAKGFAGASVSDYGVTVTQIASKASHTVKADDLVDVKKVKKGVIAVKMLVDNKEKNVYVDVVFDEKSEIDMEATAKNLDTALKDKGINVTAKYSEFSKGIVLESGKMGQNVSFELAIKDKISEEDINGKVSSFTDSYLPHSGTNAKGVISKGKETYEFDKESNLLTVDNVQFTFNSITDSVKAGELDALDDEEPLIYEDEYTDGRKNLVKRSVDGKKSTIIITSEDGKTETTININEKEKVITTKAENGAEKTTKYSPDGNGNWREISNDGDSSIKDLEYDDKYKPKFYKTSSGYSVSISDDGTKTIISEDGKTVTKRDSNGDIKTETFGEVTLNGKTDISNLKDKIVSFINDYNTLLSSINIKIYETRDKDYMPLSDEQKKEMTDDQIEKWETKAQTGLIRKDMDLERITSAMKSAMSTVISGSGLTLESIGIKPVANYAEKNGMFTVDEATLTKALEENAGNIKDLFTRAASENAKGGGIFTQLAATLKSEFKSSTASLSKKAGIDGTSTQYSNTLTKSIAKKKTLIKELNDKFSLKETSLYKKYSALETALEKLNSQQASLSSMLGTS